MFDHDKALWKVGPKYIKNPEALEDVHKVFIKNLRKLFHVFITLSAGSKFPGITWLAFGKFVE